jgi:tetratricopeptide (TPR) repeat protein
MRKYIASCVFLAFVSISPSFATGVDEANAGLELASMGLGELAASQFDEALKANDLSPENREKTLYNLGTIYLESSRPDLALSAFDEALKLSPRQTRTLINRGEALRAMGQHDEAIATLDLALAIDATLADAHFLRGLGLLSKGRLVEADVAFKTALKIKKDSRYGLGLGRSLIMQKRFAEALAAFNEAIEKDGELALVYIYRSSAYHGLGEKRRAGDDLTKAITIAPNDPLIRSYYAQRRYGKTPELYKTNIDMDTLSAPHNKAPVYGNLSKGTLIDTPSCDEAGWCRVMFGNSLAGYVKKSGLSLIP